MRRSARRDLRVISEAARLAGGRSGAGGLAGGAPQGYHVSLGAYSRAVSADGIARVYEDADARSARCAFARHGLRAVRRRLRALFADRRRSAHTGGDQPNRGSAAALAGEAASGGGPRIIAATCRRASIFVCPRWWNSPR